MGRARGVSVRLKLTLSYLGFLMLAAVLVLTAVWMFLLRGGQFGLSIPSPSDFRRVFEPGNFGPAVFAPAAIVALAFLFVFGLVGGWILAGRMLVPLSRITDATRGAGTNTLAYRIRLAGRNDEFRELADAFDDMLARLEAQVADQERFAANASHELRTPLAVTQTLLDVARNDPARDCDELIARLLVVNARAIELTEALLLLSRAGQRSFAPEPVDLSLVAEDAVESLLPLADARGVAIEVSGAAAPAVGSRALLQQVATNLLHNAILHNLAEHGAVQVTTYQEHGSAGLAIENTGELVTPQLATSLAEPFQRGNARVHGDHDGLGLGLAIVRSIVLAHDGSLEIVPRNDGGLRVTVELPAGGRDEGPSSGPTGQSKHEPNAHTTDPR